MRQKNRQKQHKNRELMRQSSQYIYRIIGAPAPQAPLIVFALFLNNIKYLEKSKNPRGTILKYFTAEGGTMMDLSKIKAVIADDDVFKGADIRKALEFNGIRNITTVRNQEKLWEQIYHAEDKIDLIVTDMQYPLETGGAVDREAGLKLIERLKKEKIDIPVIICSSSDYNYTDNILGTVWYSERNDLDSGFKEVLGRLGKDC